MSHPPPPPQRLPVLALHPKTPARVGGCPLTHHTHPSKTFSAGPTHPPSFQHPFPPPPAGEGSRDAGIRAASPLPADLAEPRCIRTPRPKMHVGGWHRHSQMPPNAHAEDPKARWASLERTSTGSCPVGSLAHTKARWSWRMERGDSSRFSMFPAQRSPDQTLRSTGRWERGAPGSGGSRFVTTTIVCPLGKEENNEEGEKNKRTKKKRTIKPKRIALVLSPPRFLCLLLHPCPPRLGFYRFFFCLRDFLRLRIIS